jgi:hypothetical protein
MKLRNLRRSKRLLRATKTNRQLPMAVPLDNCPPEIIEMVVDYLPFSDFCSIRSTDRRINYATVYLSARKYFRTFEVDFTLNGLQRLVDIANHCDISGEVRFGEGVQHISLKQAVWSEQEGAAWIKALENARTRKQRRIMKRVLATLPPYGRASHQDMTTNALYLKILTTIFRGIGNPRFSIHMLEHVAIRCLEDIKVYILLKDITGYDQRPKRLHPHHSRKV